MAQAATRGESRVGAITNAADALVAALNRNTQATTALSSMLAQVEASGSRAQQALAAVGSSAGTATTNVVQLDRSVTGARSSLDGIAVSARSATAAWAALGEQGAATAQRLDIARRMASASAAMGPGPAANSNNRLTPFQAQNLFYQGSDVVTSLGSGISPVTTLLQQGPQIAATFTGPGGASIGGAFASAGEAAASLAAKVGLVGGAIAGLTAVVIAGVTAQQSYASTQTALAQQLAGIGRASGATVSQINALAPALAASGNVSVRTAREMAGEFASTGKIGADMFKGIGETAKDYAATTGQDLPTAISALAGAFADPAKGADALNKQLGFLDAATRENIQTLSAQGDRLGAQKVLLDAYRGGLTSATELTSGWSRATAAAGKVVSDIWDTVGRAVDRVATGGDLATQIETARKVLANSQARASYLPLGIGQGDVDTAQASLDRLLAQQSREAAQARQRDMAQRSLAVDDLVKQFNPQQERLKQIENSAARIRTELAAGVLDPTGESKRTAEGLEASAKRIREDLAQGGTQFANALKEAQFAQRTVGFSPQGQRVASINERAENDIRNLQTDPNDPLLRSYQINSIRERQRLELETARQQTYNDSSSGGGRYSIGVGQAPAQYRDLFYNAGTQYGVNPDLLAAQARRESRFNPNAVSPAGAQGISQFMPETARGYGLTNPFDPAASIDAQARLMRDLLKQFNGNEVAALVGYNAGPRTAERFVRGGQDTSTLPRETQGYIREILTGQPGSQQMVEASTQRNRNLESEARLLEINNQYLGVSGEKLDAATRLQQLLNQAYAQNIEVTPAYRAELERVANAGAGAARSLAGTQAGRALDFERDQLGRDRYDQAAYARARSVFGDTSTPEAQAYIGQSRDVAVLGDARSTLTDVSTGFVQALSKGTSAAEAFSNALTRIGDKLISGALDSLIGSAFKGASGGGFLGGIGSLFGFANGGIMTGRGALPLHTYATGGVASSPQMAIFGEGRTPEAYVPLPDGRRIPVAMSAPANTNSVSSTTDARQYSFDLRGSNLSMAEVDSRVRATLSAYDAEQRRTQFDRQTMDRKAFG